MKIFFEHLYYYIYLWYNEKDKKGSKGSSCAAVSGLQLFNILSIIFLWDNITGILIDIPKYVLVIAYLLVFAINYSKYIYSDEKSLVIENSWEEKDDDYKYRYEKIMVSYIVLSVIILLGMVVWAVSLK